MGYEDIIHLLKTGFILDSGATCSTNICTANSLVELNLTVYSRTEQQRKVKSEKTKDTTKGMNDKGVTEREKKS